MDISSLSNLHNNPYIISEISAVNKEMQSDKKRQEEANRKLRESETEQS